MTHRISIRRNLPTRLGGDDHTWTARCLTHGTASPPRFTHAGASEWQCPADDNEPEDVA